MRIVLFSTLLGALMAAAHGNVTDKDFDASTNEHVRKLKDLDYVGSNPTNRYPLSHCQGDCDNDGQCEGNLVCHQRNGNDPVPGCNGSDGSRTDYCVNPSDITPTPSPTASPTRVPVPTSTPSSTPTRAPIPTTPPTSAPIPPPTVTPTRAPIPPPTAPPTRAPTPTAGDLPLVNLGDNPRDHMPLGRCEGDCDNDSQCGPGLYCYHRNGGEPVPGCIGSDGSRADYCVSDGSPTPPVAAPTNPPPTNTPSLTNFRLKLYWEQGYFWQEETRERKWCMECRGSGCSNGEKLRIFKCGDSSQRFDFVPAGGDEVLIRLRNTNLCFDRDGRDIHMRTCNSGDSKQKWFAKNGSFNGRRFEISQHGVSDLCVTQRHHPKADEEVELEPCWQARIGDTSYWNRD